MCLRSQHWLVLVISCTFYICWFRLIHTTSVIIQKVLVFLINSAYQTIYIDMIFLLTGIAPVSWYNFEFLYMPECSISSQKIFFLYLPGSSVCDDSPRILSVCICREHQCLTFHRSCLLISVMSTFECACWDTQKGKDLVVWLRMLVWETS